MTLLPEVEAALVARGESVARPEYTDPKPPAEADVEENPAGVEGDADPDANEEQMDIKQERSKKSSGKENFEATSDEEE